MAPENTDKFIKAARRWTGQIGASGVADASVTTIPLVSATSLPTDTAVQITIDRVDANGTLTPSKEEVIRGTVSGTNLIDAVRGVEGTAQAHGAGAVVEVILTSDQWNNQTDAILAEHNQDGTHKATIPVKATGAEINTGTDDDKFATPKAIADSKLADFFRGDGWLTVSDSWVYASADAPTFTITVPSGAASLYSPGMRIRLTQTTVKYFIITAVADTVLTVYGGTDYTLVNAAISAISYSTQKAPLGFPLSPAKWTEEFSDTNIRSQATPTGGTYYNIGTSTLSIPIGVWAVSYNVSIQLNAGGASSPELQTALSTANNSGSDADLICDTSTYANNIAGAVHTRTKTVALTSKTSYYLNGMIVNTIAGTLYFRGERNKTIIRAVCAYL